MRELTSANPGKHDSGTSIPRQPRLRLGHYIGDVFRVREVSGETEAMNSNGVVEIVFDVPGWPPLKNEAKSLLAAGHSQRQRVRLLEAAETASRTSGWVVANGDICLAVIVRAPTGCPEGDATNYLGGIADVLQGKSKPINIDLSHLGTLQAVALYTDDRQIRRVRYDVETADAPSYSVRVSILA
jgi:hypothetical protein